MKLSPVTLNNLHPKIKFTEKWSKDKIDFLDNDSEEG